MADGAYKEIKAGQKEIVRILSDHGDRLIRIEDQLKYTNGKVTKTCGDVDQLFSFNRDRENGITCLEEKINHYTDETETLKTCVDGIDAFKNKIGGISSIWQPLMTIAALTVARIAMIFK